ncbi:DMT family transporter [Phaeovibrio sulfidiphilus]|uniref:DMT family transporter n=1 Tax=Phaeovibrio sulfidiphilus TaxID=1220600 RepID=A0A8J6Z1D6_9PROT|nr:DMT family transporter [Phaeovibrio sulfidiphilus]MBE1237988.1 DMT family transporter [Phaeovibrio sulfidiphilus]
MDTRTAQGYAAATLQSLVIGFSFMFVVLALRSSQPLDLLSWRFAVAFVGASVPLALGLWRPGIGWRDLPPIVLAGLLYPVSFFAFQVWGLVYITSSEAGIIQACIPIFTLVLARVFLAERTTLVQNGFVVLSVAGVALIFAMNGLGVEGYDFRGLALILGSTLSIAAYNVLARKMTRRYTPFTLTYVMTGLGFLVFMGASLGVRAAEGSLAGLFSPWSDPEFALSVLYLGVLSSLGTSFLAVYSLARLEAYKVSVFGNLAIVVSVLAGFAFLGETLYWYHGVGVVAVLVGVAATGYFGQPRHRGAAD